jgi:hypothetical protein
LSRNALAPDRGPYLVVESVQSGMTFKERDRDALPYLFRLLPPPEKKAG